MRNTNSLYFLKNRGLICGDCHKDFIGAAYDVIEDPEAEVEFCVDTIYEKDRYCDYPQTLDSFPMCEACGAEAQDFIFLNLEARKKLLEPTKKEGTDFCAGCNTYQIIVVSEFYYHNEDRIILTYCQDCKRTDDREALAHVSFFECYRAYDQVVKLISDLSTDNNILKKEIERTLRILENNKQFKDWLDRDWQTNHYREITLLKALLRRFL